MAPGARRGGLRWPLYAAALVLSAPLGCANDVRSEDVPAGVVVATHRAPGLDLGARRTFAIATQVGVVGDGGAASWSPAPAVVASVSAQLEARGFTKAAEVDPAAPPGSPVAADLAVVLTALQSDRTEAAYWLASPSHASPATFGYPGLVWTYRWEWTPITPGRGTVLVELADLSAAPSAPAGTALAVEWAAFLYAVVPGVADYDNTLVLGAVERAFAQSPYLEAAP